MDLPEYSIAMGKVVVNMQSLELVLRLFLCAANGEQVEFPTPTTTSMPETHFTNYDSLGTLINKYNSQLGAAERTLEIDSSVVPIRDAFAHGRVMGPITKPPLDMIKFSRPKKGMVTVEFYQELNHQWLTETVTLLYRQMQSVISCAKGRGYAFVT